MKNKILFFAVCALLSHNVSNSVHAVTDAECDKAIRILCNTFPGGCKELTDPSLSSLEPICQEIYRRCMVQHGADVKASLRCQTTVLCKSFKNNRCKAPQG